MEVTITDSDIEKAEKIFFNFGEQFDGDRRDFIKCIDKSLHLQACPGSGKTTALLAKLYILSEKMPFENNRSICVLTHTNVAIDLIKKKLGDKANKLFSYPNFFGTIQSFVDKYLAIPAYIKCFGYRPKYIDNDFFYNRVKKYEQQFSNNNWLQKNKWRYDTVLDFVFSIEVEFLKNDGTFKLKLSRLKRKESQTYQRIYNAFEKILKDGYLRFSDAFALAKLHLDNFPKLTNIFSSRFKYVFIDEAQDTNSIQKEIIEKCFNENVIIQWIGDVNQAIMNDDYAESAWKPGKNGRYDVMYLTKSHRISQEIANIVEKISIHMENNNLEGKNINIKPKLIVFNSGQEEKVLEKFVELITKTKCNHQGKELSIYEISQQTGNPIKAVGWIGKEKDNGLSIKSYFPNFEKKLTNIKRQHFPDLYTMCQLSKNINPKDFKDRILSCILEALYISKINSLKGNRFSKSELLNFIREKDENLLNKLFEDIASYCFNDNFNNLSRSIIECLEKMQLDLNEDAKKYLTEQQNNNVNQKVATSENVFKDGKKIYIDTVHGVKGETHTATLYLETKFYENSLSYILKELQGEQTKQKSKRAQRAQRITYVAFSRPTHLLCVAMNKDEFEKCNNLKLKYFDLVNL